MSRDLTAMLRPRSIALVGATDRSRWSQNTFDNLVNRKYAGAIHLISRRGGIVHGRQAATSCVALGEPVDLALLMVPQAAVDALARQHDVSLLGPNCLGFVNFIDNVPLWTGGFRAPSKPGCVAVV